jgi:hypothetical protein
MDTALLALDVATIAATVLASWLWFVASGRRIRRVSRFEELDAADLNRIVIAINRSNLLNRRAALASGVAALLVATRWTLDLMA